MFLVMAIAEGPEFLHEVSRVGTHGPFVAVGADFAFDIEVIEQDEVAGEFVMIRRDAFGEETEFGIAVALRQVAEDLVVGAVFLDDIEAVFDRAGGTDAGGDGIVGAGGGGDEVVFFQWGAAVGEGSVVGEL